jgi:Trypsin-like peptidase domain
MTKNSSFPRLVGGLLTLVAGLSARPAVAQEGDQVQTCNASILCQPSYQVQGQAVVRVNSAGSAGTGTLIRNPLPGGNPFVLTAFHVVDANASGVIEQNEIDAIANNNNTLFVFEDHSPCGASNVGFPGARPGAYLYGAIVRAASRTYDFVLLELRAPAPFTANYATLRFSRSNQGSSFAIHHPRGTTKRIAFGNNTNNPLYGGDFLVTFNDGRVAPGSSGCPLFNSSREVYGALKRGPANCEAPCQPGAWFCGNAEFVPVIDAWYGSNPANDAGAISSLGPGSTAVAAP